MPLIAALIVVAVGQEPRPASALADYAGVYTYRNGQTVALVPKGDDLVAVIDSALYPVRHVQGDTFRNAVGTYVRFRRGASSRVVGLWEGDDYFERLRDVVPPDLVRLTRPFEDDAPPYRYGAPVSREDGVAVGDASAAGFDVGRLEGLVRSIRTEAYPNVHSVLLWRRGLLLFEEYFYGYRVDRPHQLRSATKSVVSLLVGIALDAGLIHGEAQPVEALLHWDPSNDPQPDARKARITLADLLSMRSGLACDDWDPTSPGNEQRLYSTADWVRSAMALPMIADPGTRPRYCSAGSHVAGRIVEMASGRDLLEFARSRLFGPLGIGGVRWPHAPVAANAATFGQLYLRPRDMLKLGVLVLGKGVWRGRRIVSGSWIERSTSPLTQIGSRRYGYLWWRQSFHIETPSGGTDVDTILASGNGGQKIYVVPALDLVAVFTGGNYNSDEDTPPNAIMGSVILPQLVR
jgi:CubicO group peptidase (beta-lactamase class C family)